MKPCFELSLIGKLLRYISGQKTNAASSDLSNILPEEIEEELKKAAEISMGTDVCLSFQEFLICVVNKILKITLPLQCYF